MAKFHLVALDPPPFQVYFSEGDPSITMGRAGAGNRVTLDCEEDIYCRLVWEQGELWLRGNLMEDQKLEGEVSFEVCGRKFKGSMMEGDQKQIEQPIPRRASVIQAPVGAVRSLQVFFKQPLLRVALMGQGVDRLLRDWSGFQQPAGEEGAITHLSSLPGSRLRRPDAGERQALQEFQAGNEWVDAPDASKEALGDRRFVFRIRRPGMPACFVEVMANAGGEYTKSFRNFSAHAHGLWIHAPLEEQALKQGMDFLISIEAAESDVEKRVQVVTADGQGFEEDLRVYIEGTLGADHLQVNEGPPTFVMLRSFLDQLQETRERLNRKTQRRLKPLVILGALLVTGLFLVGSGVFLKLSGKKPLTPNVQADVAQFEKSLDAEAWNEVILFLDESYLKMRSSPTEWTEFSRESEKRLRKVLEKMTRQQILRLPEAPEKNFLNVVGSLKERPEPYRALAGEQELRWLKYQQDYRAYDNLSEILKQWQGGAQVGYRLASEVDRYLARETAEGHAVMFQEIEALKAWLERPRKVEIQLLSVDWKQGTPVFTPEKYSAFKVTYQEVTEELGSMKMQAEDVTKPEEPCRILLSGIRIWEDDLYFNFELSARRWGDWKLPKTEQVFAESRVKTFDFFEAEKGVFQYVVSPLKTGSGENVGSLLVQLDMEIGESPPALPDWQVSDF